MQGGASQQKQLLVITDTIRTTITDRVERDDDEGSVPTIQSKQRSRQRSPHGHHKRLHRPGGRSFRRGQARQEGQRLDRRLEEKPEQATTPVHAINGQALPHLVFLVALHARYRLAPPSDPELSVAARQARRTHCFVSFRAPASLPSASEDDLSYVGSSYKQTVLSEEPEARCSPPG